MGKRKSSGDLAANMLRAMNAYVAEAQAADVVALEQAENATVDADREMRIAEARQRLTMQTAADGTTYYHDEEGEVDYCSPECYADGGCEHCYDGGYTFTEQFGRL